jgi:microsomal dipeptidase-like Zn-dependent dipeptidase
MKFEEILDQAQVRNVLAAEAPDESEQSDESEGPRSQCVPVDRPRGILSNTDREYLCGQRSYAHQQSEANRKQEIRERIANGLQDFILLWLLLPEDELKQTITDIELFTLGGSLSAMMAFAYQSLDGDLGELENYVERGIYFGSNWNKEDGWANSVADVKASIHLERNPNIDQLYARFKQGSASQLTPTEIGLLVRSGKLSEDELQSIADDDR